MRPLFAVEEKVVMKRRVINYSVLLLLGLFLLVGCCDVATGSLAGDLNEDDRVDFSDMQLFAGQWLDGPQYPPQGLLAHWQFDEDDGFYAIDSTSNGFTGDLIGGIIYLLSPASDYVTGQTLYIDGGYTAD